MTVQDSHVVVIGGSSGIGLATARAAAAAGARVTIASSSAAKVAEALRVLPAGLLGRSVDVRDEAALGALFAETGTFDHLVLSAGDPPRGSALADLDLAAGRQMLDVRFWGSVAAVKQALPHLSERGSVVLTSGTVAVRPFPSNGVATAVAAAVEGLARGLAVELAPVRVNVVRFGAVETPLWDSIPEPVRTGAARRTLVGRIGTPEQAAAAHLSLLENDYVTGSVLTVDGGSLLM